LIRKSNPATLELVGEIPETDPQAIPGIIEKARKAQAEWASWPLERRVRAVRGVQDRLISRREDIAKIVSQETGKPRVDALNVDMLCSLTAADYSARSMKELFSPKPVRFGNLGLPMRFMGRSSYIQNKPLGVVGIISPWNYPVGIPFSEAVMAVAAGNAVVLKPSSETPFSGLEVAKLFAEGDFPPDLVQVVVGPGRTVGKALAISGVDRIIITGSTAAGKEIMALASSRLTPVTLELGGKDPLVVFDDADLERAVEGAVWGSFVNAGQTCVCVKRIYVQEGVYDRFLAMFTDRVSKLRLGWGWDDPDIDVGPLISAEALERMEAVVQQAVNDGGKVVAGGKRAEGLKGYFFRPTIVVDLPHSSTVVQEEVFGPLVTVHRFATEEEAVRLANDSPYALSGSVWTGDLAKGRRVAQSMSGGTVLVNNVGYTFGLAMTPWGGKGMSGFGRTHGELGFAELVEPHHVHVDRSKFPREVWWHPYSKERLDAGRGLLDALYDKNVFKRLSSMLKLGKIMKGK
jgi:acyl-CoA reductase-like NAD-dependent aldehyde dehydrogenase